MAPARFEVPIVQKAPKSRGEERFASLLSAERDAIAAIRELGGEVQVEGDEVVAVRLRGEKVTNQQLRFRSFPFLRTLELRDCAITDEGLERLAGLTNLEHLQIDAARVSDAGLTHLSDLKNLKHLDLARTPITDAGLEHLRGLTGLRKLNVSGTRVTAEGLRKLQAVLPDLKVGRD